MKYDAILIYLLLLLCMSVSHILYQNSNTLNYTLLGNFIVFIPIVTYKISLSYKLIFFIFIQMFMMIYMYIFRNRTIMANIFELTNEILYIILLYSFYWKYILYTTTSIDIGKSQFHIYGIVANFGYFFNDKLLLLYNTFNFIDIDILVFSSSILYVLLGGLIFKFYKTEEKHVLYSDYINKRKLFNMSLCYFFNEVIFMYFLKQYKINYHKYDSMVIATFFILSLNGKLLQILPYQYLCIIPSIIYSSVFILLHFFKNTTIQGISLIFIIGIRNVVFETSYKLLQISHKKQVIEKLVNIDIFIIILAHIVVHFLPFNFYFSLFFCLLFGFFELFTIKWMKKDLEINECLNELESTQIANFL